MAMETPRGDWSGTVCGRGHPWVRSLQVAIERGHNAGTLRLLTNRKKSLFVVMPAYPAIVAFEAIRCLPIVLPRCVATNDSLCVYHGGEHYWKEHLPTHIRVHGGIATQAMLEKADIAL